MAAVVRRVRRDQLACASSIAYRSTPSHSHGPVLGFGRTPMNLALELPQTGSFASRIARLNRSTGSGSTTAYGVSLGVPDKGLGQQRHWSFSPHRTRGLAAHHHSSTSSNDQRAR